MTRRGLALTVAVAVAVSGGLAVGPLPVAEGAEFACGDRVLMDYAQPFERMPHNRLPGESLSFAPRGVELRAGKSVVVEGEPIAYTLVLGRPVSADGRGPRLAAGWVLSLELEPVDRQGRPTAAAERRRWRIGKLSSAERQFGLRADPGLYSVSVRIRKLGGPVLGSYRQFVRVLPLRWELGVEVRGGGSFRPGDIVTARIENRGTREVVLSDGSALTVERLQGETWTAIMAEQAPDVWFGDPEFLAGGRASGCSFFTISPDSPPGAFRFSVDAQIGAGKTRTVFGWFVVS